MVCKIFKTTKYMTDKETAIGILESIVHWMKKSKMDYEPRHLDIMFKEVKEHYSKYLYDKKRN